MNIYHSNIKSTRQIFFVNIKKSLHKYLSFRHKQTQDEYVSSIHILIKIKKKHLLLMLKYEINI